MAPVASLRPVHLPAAFVAGVAVVCGAVWLSVSVSAAQAALLLVGVAAGMALYHAAFGFTSSWRALIAHGRGAGVRAQMVMLAVTTAVFVPLMAKGTIFGHLVQGSVAPVGVPVIVGAFLFGIGMQLGGGCASGTLFSAGGGSVRMYLTLVAFIVGSVIGLYDAPRWEHAPALPPISLLRTYGPVGALAVTGVVCAAIYLLAHRVERRRHGAVATDEVAGQTHAWRGPWTLLAGGLALAAVNIATLLLAGRPWGVTAAFGLWGSKAAQVMGLGVAQWPYWSATPARAAQLVAPITSDVTSVMDIGIMLGALAAAALAGRFAPVWRIAGRSALAAVVGGLLLGYGARIAFGCNIGAYFSGIASTSLHGWVWAAAAFAGNIVGTRLRPACGLSV